jgi:hypothetical protein
VGHVGINYDLGLNTGRNEGEDFGLKAVNRIFDYENENIEPGEQSDAVGGVKEETEYKFSAIESCFDGPFNNFISRTRYFWILAGLALAGYAGIRVQELEGLKELEAYFPKDHSVMVGFQNIMKGFNEGNL